MKETQQTERLRRGLGRPPCGAADVEEVDSAESTAAASTDSPVRLYIVVDGLEGGSRRAQERAVREHLSAISVAKWGSVGTGWRLLALLGGRGRLTVVAFDRARPFTEWAGRPLPAGAEKWSEVQWMGFDATHRLLGLFDKLRSKHPTWNLYQVHDLFIHKYGRWARQRGLACTPRSVRRYRARLDPSDLSFDGNTDRRGLRIVRRGRRKTRK